MKWILVPTLAALVLFSGCAIVTSAPINGALTLNARGPVTGVDNNVRQAKMCTAMSESILGIAYGDSSITAAMEMGGITKVHHVDCEALNVFGIYARFKTIVYGE